MQKTGKKGVQDQAQLDGKGDPLGIVHEIIIQLYYQINPRKWEA